MTYRLSINIILERNVLVIQGGLFGIELLLPEGIY